MKIAQSMQGRVSIMRIEGPIIADELSALDTEIDTFVNAGSLYLVLELKQVPFIDSAGLEKLQGIATEIGRRGGEVRLCSLNETCRDILYVTRLEGFFQNFETREAAIGSLS